MKNANAEKKRVSIFSHFTERSFDLTVGCERIFDDLPNMALERRTERTGQDVPDGRKAATGSARYSGGVFGVVLAAQILAEVLFVRNG